MYFVRNKYFNFVTKTTTTTNVIKQTKEKLLNFIKSVFKETLREYLTPFSYFKQFFFFTILKLNH